MSVIDWLNIVAGVISVVAFVGSAWIWLQARHKMSELVGTIQTMHEIAGSIIWERHTVRAEDTAVRLRQADLTLGLVAALFIQSSKYAKSPSRRSETELGMLLERGVILTPNMIWDIEASERTKEIWLLTPDLEPDASDNVTGALVAKNLRSGKRYVYFYPGGLTAPDELKARLLVNVGATSTRMASRVTLVPVDRTAHEGLFHRGNSIIFFRGEPGLGIASSFEEVVLTKVSQRGMFWQEHEDAVSETLRRRLATVLETWRGVSPR